MSEPIAGGRQNPWDDGSGTAPLLERIAAGDREAFHAFYLRYAGRVMGFLRGKVREPQMAEELMEDVFVAAWLSARAYRPDLGDAEAWLFGIARHKVMDHWRRIRRIATDVALSAVKVGTPPSEGERRLVLEQALGRLPAAQRRVVDLIYLHGLTFVEAAHALGIPPGTVKSRVNAALGTMRAFLAGTGGP